MKYRDGSTFEGDFANDYADGQGCWISKKYGYTFEGEFSRDRSKKGVIKWPNGDTWKGHFIEQGGELTEESEGEMLLAETGNVVRGRWDDYSMKKGKGEMVMWLKEENREVRGKWIEGGFVPETPEEEAERTKREEAEMGTEEAEANAREEAEKVAREAADIKAREEEAEMKAREEAEMKAREEAETKAREAEEARRQQPQLSFFDKILNQFTRQ